MRKLLSLLMCVLCVVGLSGCGNNNKDKSSVESKNLKIVTSFYPIYIQTLNVTKGVSGVTVENMTANNVGDIHDYQMTPADRKKIDSANILVINGAGMEPFLNDVLSEQKQLKVIDASKGIALIHDDHGPNPHIWLNVSNVIQEVNNIADSLAEIDPKNADQYKHNAQEYIAKLELLQKNIHGEIDKLPYRQIVTFHEAFPYFAKEFNLDVVGVIEVEPGDTPSPKELEEIAGIVNKMKHKVIFTEPNFAPDAAKTIAQETGAQIYSLDPGESGKDDLNAYIDMMKENAKILAKALQ